MQGEANRFSFPPVYCTNTARQTMHNKAEIQPDTHESEFGSKSDENRTVYEQPKAGRTLEDFKPNFKADLHPEHFGE